MAGEGVGEPQLSGQLGAEQAGAQKPDRHAQAGARHGADGLVLGGRFEPLDQFDHVARKLVGAFEIATQSARGGAVRAGRAAQAQVDPVGEQGLQRAELFGHDQRRVIGQHDAARADADALRPRRHMADDDGGRGAGDAGHVVVFGQPEPPVAQAVGGLGEGQVLVEGAAGVAAFDDGRQVED